MRARVSSARHQLGALVLLFALVPVLDAPRALASEADPNGPSSAVPAGRAEEAAPDAATSEGKPSRGPWRNFWHDHGWKLLATFAIDQTGQIYERSVGPSNDPLFFDDPPGIDETIRDHYLGETGSHGFIEKYGLETLRYGGVVGLILLDSRKGRTVMAHDVLGFIETYYTNRGFTNLLKNIVGRERPTLEFADPNVIGQPAFEEKLDDPHEHQSFPSGHASGSFAFASYLERAVAHRVGLRGWKRYVSFSAFYGYAGYIAYTRVHRDKHYFTDILAGGALGTGVGRWWYRVNHPDEFGEHRGPSAVSFGMPTPIPGGMAITASIDLTRLFGGATR